MPTHEVPAGVDPVTRPELAAGLRELGVRPAALLMVHTRMSRLGWVVGGEDALVQSLLDVLGTEGTLAAMAGWVDDSYHLRSWPERWQRAYRAGLPPFDPAVSAADHGFGRMPERIRTWPGACRGDHPQASFVAVGARANWLVHPHTLDDAFGAGTPLARLVESDGQVLMLGAPLSTITLLHHAEAIVALPGKLRVTYEMPILEDGNAVWRLLSDIDTSRGAFPYDTLDLGGRDPFEVIAEDALRAGCGASGKVGSSTSHLFEARALLEFACRWLERRFG